MTPRPIAVERIETTDVQSLLPAVKPPCLSRYAPMSRNFAEAQRNRMIERPRMPGDTGVAAIFRDSATEPPRPA